MFVTTKECQEGHLKKTRIEFIKAELDKKNMELLDEFVTVKTRSKFRCKVCGREWYTCVDNLLNSKRSCLGCLKLKKRDEKRDEINERLRKRNIEIVGEYKTSTQKDRAKNRFRCLVEGCGYEWETSVGCVYKFGCKRCSGTEPLTKEIVSERIKHKPIKMIGEYKSVDTKTIWKCLVEGCDYEWEAVPYSVMNRHGCPKCGGRLKLDEDEVKNELLKRDIRLLDPFIRAKNKVNFSCLCCGHVWNTSTDSVLRGGTGCPLCRKKNEKRLVQFLESQEFEVKTQKKIIIDKKRLFIDFVVNDVFIEYNGKQHYEPVEFFGGVKSHLKQRIRDEKLRCYCDKEKIKLIEIPFWVEEEIQHKLLLYELNISED